MNTKDLFSLKGRVALITGGSRGIGRMIAEGFIAQGAKVYISARKADTCNQTAKELSKDGGACISIPMNVSTVAGAKGLAAAVMAQEPKVDILVNNAGAAWGAAFDEFPEEGWDKVLNLNAKTPFFLTQAMAPALRNAASPARPAKVINIASIDGISVNPQETYSYAASKAGLIGLMLPAARDLAQYGIRVVTIAPGLFDTGIFAGVDPKVVAAIGSAALNPARLGDSGEFASLVMHIVENRYINATTLSIDAGARLPNV